MIVSVNMAGENSRSFYVPKYEKGDYIKVEFPDETTGVGEWMWVRVQRCDDEQRLVFGVLDSVPIATQGVRLGAELAISFDNIRDHKKSYEFGKPN
jgi:uncharacterized protein YegJ (DUF2314 family)